MILNAFAQHNNKVEAGTTYGCRSAGGAVELARVIDVGPDRMGIPHVRFNLQVQSMAGRPAFETRTLSLEAFQSRFRQRLKDSL